MTINNPSAIRRRRTLCLLPALLGVGGAFLLLLLAGGPVRSAKAAPAGLTYPGCAPTIQECLDNAPVNGSVVISPGTYITSLTLSQAVNLTGVNSATTILQALSGQRVLTVTGVDVDNSVLISGLTISGGIASGGSCPAGCGGGIAILNQAEPRLDNLIVISNTAGRAGGGVYAAGPLNLAGSLLVGNSCAGYPCWGGAVEATGPLVIGSSRLISNTSAERAGAVYAESPLTITATRIEQNLSASEGGGVFQAWGYNTGYVADSQFVSNTASSGGGAWFDGNATIQGSLFQSNRCTETFNHGCGGGGLFALTNAWMTNTQFLSNTGGEGAGAFINYAATVTGGLFQNNQSNGLGDIYGTVSTGAGGGLYAGSLTMSGTEFLSNTATFHGGGIFVGSANIGGLAGVVIEHNMCTLASCMGGGLYASYAVNLSDMTVWSNTAHSNGGGIFANSDINLTGGSLGNNQCLDPGCTGGGLNASGTLALTGTTVVSNAAQGSGGGLYATGAVTLTNGIFQANQCLSGGCSGGGLRAASTLTLGGTRFLGNHSQSNGGGAYAASAASVQGALFQDNSCGQAGCSGGGLYAKNGLGLFATQFQGNHAQANGGGLAQAGGAGQVVNSLFARNSTLGGNGEALYLASPGSVAILHTTIASPTLASGAAIAVVTGTVGITDTIIASHTIGISRTAGVALADYNLFFSVPVTITGGVIGGGHNRGGDPLFVDPAGDNYHLSSGSAAVDVGAAAGVATDYEGDPRPGGVGFDIGFDEARSPTAATDAFSLPPNSSLVVAAPGLLANDNTLNAGPLTALLVTGPATGSLVVVSTGAFTYTPPLNFTGPVTFTYRANDGQFLSAPAVVTLTVNPFKLYLPLVLK